MLPLLLDKPRVTRPFLSPHLPAIYQTSPGSRKSFNLKTNVLLSTRSPVWRQRGRPERRCTHWVVPGLPATASEVLIKCLNVSFLKSDCHRLFAKNTFSIQNPAVPCTRFTSSVRPTGGQWALQTQTHVIRVQASADVTSGKINFTFPEVSPPQPSSHKIGLLGVKGLVISLT